MKKTLISRDDYRFMHKAKVKIKNNIKKIKRGI